MPTITLAMNSSISKSSCGSALPASLRIGQLCRENIMRRHDRCDLRVHLIAANSRAVPTPFRRQMLATAKAASTSWGSRHS